VHNLKAVVRTVNLIVVIRREKYLSICSNYKVLEKCVRSVTSRGKKCISFMEGDEIESVQVFKATVRESILYLGSKM